MALVQGRGPPGPGSLCDSEHRDPATAGGDVSPAFQLVGVEAHMKAHLEAKLLMSPRSNEPCTGHERPVVAFRLLWWLEGYLDLLISRAAVGTSPCLCTALHCATEMSPVLNIGCCHHPCPLWLYHPCFVHPCPQCPSRLSGLGGSFCGCRLRSPPACCGLRHPEPGR